MEKLQKLPVTQSSFESIIKEGLLYVDKTKQVLTLLDHGKYLLLSRPRRFGKSLLVSTLKCLFEGKKQLFKGLHIEDKWEWEEYPIIWIDFSVIDYLDSSEDFKEDLADYLKNIGRKYEVEIAGRRYKPILRNLIQELNKKFGKGVVVLIDEYDKPITDFIDNPIRVEENRKILKDFYDGVIEFGDTVYIIEFKHKRSGTLANLTKTALQQIKDKNYTQAYEGTHAHIHLVGIGFLEKNKDEKGQTLLEIDAKWQVHKG